MKGLATRHQTSRRWGSDRLGHAYVDFAEESQAEVHCVQHCLARFRVHCPWLSEPVRSHVRRAWCLQRYLYQALSVLACLSWTEPGRYEQYCRPGDEPAASAACVASD